MVTNFRKIHFKVIRFDPLAPVQKLVQRYTLQMKMFFSVNYIISWIWTAAAKSLFSHFLRYDMIYFVLIKSPWFYCYRHICYFDGRCQIAKSNRWTRIFLLRVAINKALLASTQSFTSFVYKTKRVVAKRYYQMPKESFGLRSKNVGSKCFGAVWVDHCCSKRLLLRNEGQSTAKQSGIDLTLTNFHAFSVHKKDGSSFRVV